MGDLDQSLLGGNSLPEQPAGTEPPKNHVSRHRRVHKEVGAITGVTFIDHPKGHGVVVNVLDPEGACAKSGVRVGDHVVKINGERPKDKDHAVTLCDAAWLAEADGTDKNKDRLKFSLHLRTQDFAIGRFTSGLSAGALVGVEVVGGVSSAKKSLLGGGKKQEDSGLGVEDSPAGFGAIINFVARDSLAEVAGLEVGLAIVSVDGVLCPNAKGTTKMMNEARAKKGGASLVCHLKKTTEEDKEGAEHL